MSDDEDNTPLPPMLQEDADATLYKYRDFSSVPEENDGDPNTAQANRCLESSIRVQKFPVKLYAILAQKEFGDIITWMPHGRSWRVMKPNLFESLVMPLFFEYSNYHSFNRLVNAWSFRRISSGPDRGSYYHELFLRGKPHLQKYMRRLPKTHKKLPMKKHDEPDFYKLDKSSPLPDLVETQAANSLHNNAFGLRRQQGINSLPGGLHAGLAGSMTNALPQGFPGIPQQMGQLGQLSQLQGTGGMNQGGGLQFGFNKTPKDAVNGMGVVNSMGGLGGFNDPLRSQNMGGLSVTPAPGGRQGNDLMGGGNAPSGGDNQLFQLQRLRHLQHLQLFQRQIGAASLAGSEDLARIQAEHALGLR